MNLIRRIRARYVLLTFLFIFTAVFVFLRTKTTKNTGAASLVNFNPGNIMSDYVMSNHDSMTEAQIQSFLKSKNSCNDTNLSKARTSIRTYHVENGHYVCMADDLFPDTYVDEPLGLQPKPTSGETAAHIIWQAAQDYQINPQVLIVLLQKEQGLITDTWPTATQYRSATGYGCPDTAACNSKYYGFKNQIRNAAALFRTVLNGGWTNFPLGENYIQYNPTASCGGSIVNVQSLATSALYRYTPYQPNRSALAAGYGSGDGCGSYGNRNFYLYFSDWFGDTTQQQWIDMDTPRFMTSIDNAGEIYFYTQKNIQNDGSACLRSEYSVASNTNECVMMNKLIDTQWEWIDMDQPRYFKSNNANVVYLSTKQPLYRAEDMEFYSQKAILPDGSYCLRKDASWGNNCVMFSDLSNPDWSIGKMSDPRNMHPVNNNISPYNLITTSKTQDYLDPEHEYFFETKIILPDGSYCLTNQELFNNTQALCVKMSELKDVWTKLNSPKVLSTKKATHKINADTGNYQPDLHLDAGLIRNYVSQKFTPNGWCLQTEYDYELKTNNCVLKQDLQDAWISLENPREMDIRINNIHKIDAISFKEDTLTLNTDMRRKYVTKIFLPEKNEWCLRTEYDTDLQTNNCILLSLLKEIF